MPVNPPPSATSILKFDGRETSAREESEEGEQQSDVKARRTINKVLELLTGCLLRYGETRQKVKPGIQGEKETLRNSTVAPWPMFHVEWIFPAKLV